MEQYQIFPKTVLANAKSQISIRPCGRFDIFEPVDQLKLLYSPVEWTAVSDKDTGLLEQAIPFELHNGTVIFQMLFASEQEHFFQLKNARGQNICTFIIYSVEADLYGLLPLCGDLHMHSNRSDGLAPPGAMAAAAVDAGFNFIALTDHGQYQPSLKLIEIMRDSGSGLKIYPGEEVHPPGNPVHIVNFGGGFSINELFHVKSDEYAEAVARRVAQLDIELPEELKIQLASAEWCCDKIREGGGLAIYCHPYWKTHSNRYYVAEALTTALLRRHNFDALEVLGGFLKTQIESNTLQLARYHEERAAGNPLPIVGASDAHTDSRKRLFGWYSTMVFARNNSLAGIIAGVSSFRSVAVEDIPGETIRVHGPFRLVKYAMFLLREVFPEYREIRRREAVLLRSYLGNGEATPPQLTAAADVAAQYLSKHGLTG
jgi:predicted metal-dependent phosphoesterase TrpH